MISALLFLLSKKSECCPEYCCVLILPRHQPAKPPGTYASVGYTYEQDDSDDDDDDSDEDGAQPPPPPLPPPPSSFHSASFHSESNDDLTSGKEREINRIAEDFGISGYCRVARQDKLDSAVDKQRKVEYGPDGVSYGRSVDMESDPFYSTSLLEENDERRGRKYVRKRVHIYIPGTREEPVLHMMHTHQGTYSHINR